MKKSDAFTNKDIATILGAGVGGYFFGTFMRGLNQGYNEGKASQVPNNNIFQQETQHVGKVTPSYQHTIQK